MVQDTTSTWQDTKDALKKQFSSQLLIDSYWKAFTIQNMFTLSIETENEAFTIAEGIADGQEIARILKEVAIQLENGKEFGTLKDVNGNKVGNWSK